MRLILILLIGCWVATSCHAWFDFLGSPIRGSSSHGNRTSHEHHEGSSSTAHRHGSHSRQHGNDTDSSTQPEQLQASDNSTESKVHNGTASPEHHHHHHHKAKESPVDHHKTKRESVQGKTETKSCKHTKCSKQIKPSSAIDQEHKKYDENTLHLTDWHTYHGHYHPADEHGNQFESTSYRGNSHLHHPHHLHDGESNFAHHIVPSLYGPRSVGSREHEHPDPNDDASGVHDPHHASHRHHHHHHHHHNHHGSPEHGGHPHDSFLHGQEHYRVWHSSGELPIQPCPMLYTRIGRRCIAIFSIGQTSWSGANSFCETIYGELLVFKNIEEYLEFLEFLQISDLNADLWVGGKTDGRSWRWIDGSRMPMGSPYWAIRTNNFPSWRINEEHYYQTPSKIVTPHAGLYQSKCASMSSKYYYYMSDEDCDARRSPVCVLKNDAEIVVLKQWAENGDIPVESFSPATSSRNSDDEEDEDEPSEEDEDEPSEEDEDEPSEEDEDEPTEEEEDEPTEEDEDEPTEEDEDEPSEEDEDEPSEEDEDEPTEEEEDEPTEGDEGEPTEEDAVEASGDDDDEESEDSDESQSKESDEGSGKGAWLDGFAFDSEEKDA